MHNHSTTALLPCKPPPPGVRVHSWSEWVLRGQAGSGQSRCLKLSSGGLPWACQVATRLIRPSLVWEPFAERAPPGDLAGHHRWPQAALRQVVVAGRLRVADEDGPFLAALHGPLPQGALGRIGLAAIGPGQLSRQPLEAQARMRVGEALRLVLEIAQRLHPGPHLRPMGMGLGQLLSIPQQGHPAALPHTQPMVATDSPPPTARPAPPTPPPAPPGR